MMARGNECALVVRRRAVRCHRRLLIATDLDEARVASPIIERVDTRARIAVLGTYRIPFSGLHTLWGLQRLKRELAARTRETMFAFVESTGLDSSRFELLACHGDPRDHVVREALSRGSDLVVLAFDACSCRAQQRIAEQLLEETRCDLVIVHDGPRPEDLGREALVAVGPWAC